MGVKSKKLWGKGDMYGIWGAKKNDETHEGQKWGSGLEPMKKER